MTMTSFCPSKKVKNQKITCTPVTAPAVLYTFNIHQLHHGFEFFTDCPLKCCTLTAQKQER